MKTPCGIELKVGQKWREVDPRFYREITVLSWDEPSGTVRIKFIRETEANIRRFNGKRGGYAYVSG